MQNALVDRLFDAMKLMAFLGVCVLFFVDIRKHMQKSFDILLLLLWAEMLVSTLMSDDASLRTYLTTVITVFGSCFMIEAISLHSPMKGLKSMYLYFSTCVLINTLTVFLYPNALYPNNRNIWCCWFLGEDNVGYSYYIAASVITMLYSRCISKRITYLTVLVWVSSFLFVFHNDIATGIVSQFFFLMLVLGYWFGWFRKLINAKTSLYITVGGFLLLVVTRWLIIEPITSVLGRSVTFSGRTVLWDYILKRLWEQCPFMGFGVIYKEIDFRNIISLPTYLRGLSSAHNLTLQFFFWGGLLGLILFFIVIWSANRDGNEFRQSNVYQCCAIGLIVFSVRFLMEQGNHHFFFMFLALLSYCREFESNMETEEVPTHAARIRFKQMPDVRLSFIRR